MKRNARAGLVLLVLALAGAPMALAQGGGGGKPKGDAGAIHAADKERAEIKDDLGPKAVEGDLDALKKLVEFLKFKHPLVRDDAFQWILKVKVDKSVDWLIEHALSDADPEVRADIIEVLVLDEVKRAVPALLKLLGKDKENRPQIIASIGDLGGKENVEAVLAESKKGKEARARAEAIEALAKLDKDALSAPARSGTADPEWHVRVASLRALAAADEDAAFDGALANLKERRADEEHKRKNAWQPAFMSIKVVLGLEQREKRVEGLKDAIDQLVALLKHERGRMKHEVGDALRTLVGKPDMDDDPKAWDEFWAVKRTSYEPKDTPRKAASGGDGGKGWKKRGKKGDDKKDDGKDAGGGDAGGGDAGGAPAAGEGMVGTGVRFHGIPVWSDRVCFVIDLSGSMNNEMDVKSPPPPPGPSGTGERDKNPPPPATVKRKKLDVSKEELAKTVNSLPEDVMFNIVTFGTAVTPWQKAIVTAAKAAKATAVEFIQKLKIEGRTNFYGALSKPLEDPLVDTVYFLTDGGSTTEGKFIDQRRIVRKLHELNKYSLVEINCLLFGAEGKVSANAIRWMEDLSSESNGKFYIRPEQN